MAALTYEAALEALADRGRFGIRLGLGRTRALLRELGNPQRSVRGALVAGTNGKGSVLALAGAALAGRRIPGGNDAQTAPRELPRTTADRRAAGRSRDVCAPCRARSFLSRTGWPDGTATRPSSSCSPRSSSAGSRRSNPMSRSSKSDSGAGWTRHTSGMAASRRSPTSRSTTWSSSARRSRQSPARRPRSSNAATSR